jgi:hypothetical protein
MILNSRADVHSNNPAPQIVQQKHDIHPHCNYEFRQASTPHWNIDIEHQHVPVAAENTPQAVADVSEERRHANQIYR